MVGDSEPLIPGREEPLIPFTDRRAPVLGRLRERRSKRNNLGLHVGSKVATLALFSDEEERLEEGKKVTRQFRRGLAEEFGVPEEAINEDLLKEFMAMFTALDESDIVDEVKLEGVEQPEAEESEEEVEVEDEDEDGEEDNAGLFDDSDE